MSGEAIGDLLRRVPPVRIDYDGHCRQALGADLPIAVINLPHRTDRWEAISTRMHAVGLDRLIKVPAVAGAKLPLADISALLRRPADDVETPPESHLSLTRPAIGCFLSHLAIWRFLIESGLPRLMVFEDDANPAPKFDAGAFRAMLAGLPADADMVFVGRIIMNGMADRPAPGATLARLYYFNGTFAYLITPAGARTLIRALDPPDRHIDHQISKVMIEQRQTFPVWYTEPHFFEPDWSLRSDCYVPIEGETAADRELGALLDSNRRLLLDESRPLLPAG
jgi:GR25 family glycosyltransferase involved in LPS biosynthesis